jgi:hypothetical protein
METWHYVAIGAVVVVAGVVYYRRRNRKAAQDLSQKQREGLALAKHLKAVGVKTAADPVFTKADAEGPVVKMGMGAGGAVELSRSLY